MTPDEFRQIAAERRKETIMLRKRIDRLEQQNQELADTIGNLSKEVEKSFEKLSDVFSAFEAASGAFKVLEFLGKLAKPLVAIGAAITGILALWGKFKG